MQNVSSSAMVRMGSGMGELMVSMIFVTFSADAGEARSKQTAVYFKSDIITFVVASLKHSGPEWEIAVFHTAQDSTDVGLLILKANFELLHRQHLATMQHRFIVNDKFVL